MGNIAVEIMTSSTDKLKDLVNDLQSSENVDAAAVIRRDGVLIASNLPPNFKEKEIFAVMSAAILRAAENISTRHEFGLPSRIIVETKQGNIVISGAGSKALLVCLVNNNGSS